MENLDVKTGLAMYTVHKSTAADMYGTFRKLHELGYKGIEFYGEQNFDLEILKKSLKDAELTMTGWHVEWANLQDDTFDRTVAYLKEAGCPIAVIPCLGGKWHIGHEPEEECKEVWLRYFDKMTEIQEKLAREGIRTAYHNHEHEFQLSYDGKKLFDFIFDTLPKDFIIEFDSGNCIEGGDDPMRILRKYHDRDMILHLKPYSKVNGFNTWLNAPDDENDWKSILDPKNKSYMWMLVESENDILDEFENCRRCMDGFRTVTKEMR